MALIFIKRRKVKVCYERLGLLLLGGITTVIVLRGYPTPALEEKDARKITFDINDDGVVIVLDIPNTGTSSLANYMIKNAILEPPCLCQIGHTKCKCLNKQGLPWLFHAFNTTGYVCGEHADFTTLTNCPIDYWFRTSGKDNRPSRQYLLLTMIRDPVTRYISQWRSLTQEDMFFRNEPRLFRNQNVQLQKMGVACYVGKKLSALSLQDFLNCSQNGAINMQTRMLANMTFVNSLGLTGKTYQEAMLNSAKRTLQMLPFFGLFDRPNDSLKLLESTLGLKFRQPLNLEDPAVLGVFPLPVLLQHQILHVNYLDLKLYQHARLIFQQRVKAVRFPSSDNIGNKNLGDNDKIIYRPDLFDKTDSKLAPDITFDSNLDGNIIVDEKYTNIGNDINDDKEDEYDIETKQDEFPPKDTSIETKEENNEKDNEVTIEIENEKKGNLIGESNNVPGFSGTRVKLDNESIDYKPDIEDVFEFLSRLDRIKQQQKSKDFIEQQNYLLQQKSKDFIEQQNYLLQQKPLPQSQLRLPQTARPLYPLLQKPLQSQNQLMQRQALGFASNIGQNKAINNPLQAANTFSGNENHRNRRPIVSQRDAKPHQLYILTDPIDAPSPKRVRNAYEKGVNSMFI